MAISFGPNVKTYRMKAQLLEQIPYLRVVKIRQRCYAIDVIDPKLVLRVGKRDRWR